MLMIALIEAIALHEFAHALVADLQGDRLPRAMGRLSLNPTRHLDPLGTVFIVLLGFGWGKPVEFRPSALASKRFGAAMVALAGPLTNFVLAVAAAFPLAALLNRGDFSSPIVVFLSYFVPVNALLAVFNLLPLPPLDGSRLLTIFLPPRRQNIIYFLDRWGFLILIGIVFLGGSAFLLPVRDHLVNWMLNLAGSHFRI
ncbi:MAG: hypothetical protein QOC87_624 [Actinomycetota bacterium]|nr:hypothetical protein [Actinomycetota bacterium]